MQKFNKDILNSILENIDNLNVLVQNLEIFNMKHTIFYHLKTFEDLGITKYSKRNYRNWYYWWYEVPDGEKFNKNIFTADLKAFKLTFKGYKIYELLNKKEYYNFWNIYNEFLNFQEFEPAYNIELINFHNNKLKIEKINTEKQLQFL